MLFPRLRWIRDCQQFHPEQSRRIALFGLRNWPTAKVGLQLPMAMSIPSPHYLLFSEASHNAQQGSAWRFVLESVNTQRRFAATDVEPQAEGERLELLAVVRGLEAIEQPARVTLVTKSRYVSRGLKFGISDWRSKGWRWERFGKLVPVRDDDLWRRVDRALEFHRVECRAWQFSHPEDKAKKRVVKKTVSIEAQEKSSPFEMQTVRRRRLQPGIRSRLRNRLDAFLHGHRLQPTA